MRLLRRRDLVVVAAALALMGAARSGEAATSLAAGPAYTTMADLEAKIADSLRVGHVVPVVFDSAAQVPGHVIAAPYWGDTQLWSGVYVGGESMRYATAQHYLSQSSLSASERASWLAHRDEALERIRTILDAQHRDVTIAQDWKTALQVPPALNTGDPTGPQAADFGGGIVHGERGYVMRACTPKGLGPLGVSPPNVDPANPANNHSNHVYEITWRSGDGGTYYCESSPSRDTYAGLVFGMLTAFDLVGPDQPALRSQIRNDLVAIGDYLLRHGWSLVRPTGTVSTGFSENSFIEPLMGHVPLARLNIANAVRHVTAAVGPAADRLKWQAVWAQELATQGPLLAPALQVDAAQPNQGYFKFNLDHLLAFDLLRTTSGVARTLIARGFSVIDKTTGDDLNAHFEAITYAVTGDARRRDSAITHLDQWRAYRQATAGGVVVDNSSRCGHELTCVPEDRLDFALAQAPGGSVTLWPGTSTALRAARPIPISQRAPTDFLWQAAPTQLKGQRPAEWREPGIDYLTPYWMLRYFTEVATPPSQPLPAWAGPASV